MKKLFSTRGAIGLETLFTIVGMVGIAIATFYSTTNNTDNKISDIRVDFKDALASTNSNVAVLQTKSDATDKRLERFEAKLDAVLEKQHIDPEPINARFPQPNQIVFSTTSPS